jgi:hypothetical protein
MSRLNEALAELEASSRELRNELWVYNKTLCAVYMALMSEEDDWALKVARVALGDVTFATIQQRAQTVALDEPMYRQLAAADDHEQGGEAQPWRR